MSKSIEEMTHDYVIACLQSGRKQDDINIDVAITMAEEVKSKGRLADREREEHEREDRKNRHY